MFSLIVTIISIALVAALALASIYYGGVAFNRSDLESKTATLMLHQQQLRAALTLYRVDNNGKNPASMSDLLTGNYLKQTPTFAFSTTPPSLALGLPQAQAAPTPWIMPTAYNGTFVLNSNVGDSLCAELNYKARGIRAIPNQLYVHQMPIQCYRSSDHAKNIVVVGDSADEVADALTGGGTPTATPFVVGADEINTEALVFPSASEVDKWALPPASAASDPAVPASDPPVVPPPPPEISLSCTTCSSSVNLAQTPTFSHQIAAHTSQPGSPVVLSFVSNTPSALTCAPQSACSISTGTLTLLADATITASFTPSSNAAVAYSLSYPQSDSVVADNTISRQVAVSNFGLAGSLTALCTDCTGVLPSAPGTITRTYKLYIKNFDNKLNGATWFNFGIAYTSNQAQSILATKIVFTNFKGASTTMTSLPLSNGGTSQLPTIMSSLSSANLRNIPVEEATVVVTYNVINPAAVDLTKFAVGFATALPANPFYFGSPVSGFYPDYDLSDNWAYGI